MLVSSPKFEERLSANDFYVFYDIFRPSPHLIIKDFPHEAEVAVWGRLVEDGLQLVPIADLDLLYLEHILRVSVPWCSDHKGWCEAGPQCQKEGEMWRTDLNTHFWSLSQSRCVQVIKFSVRSKDNSSICSSSQQEMHRISHKMFASVPTQNKYLLFGAGMGYKWPESTSKMGNEIISFSNEFILS